MTGRVNLGNSKLFNEPYGYTLDGSAVIADSDQPTPGKPMSAQIMLFPLNGSAPTRLTSSLGTGYQEFSFLRPDHSSYVISSGYQGWISGTDRWLVSSSTPNAAPVRLTHFADPSTGHPLSGISGGMAFISNQQAAVGFTQNGVESTYLVAVP
jgi:Tol biopolymer transport system component